MLLSLPEAAVRLGKTRRQLRYMIQQGRLKARKDGGRWVVDADQLPLEAPALAAQARRDERLREAADQALGPRPAGRWGLRDLRAIAIGVPLYRGCVDLLGADATPATELRAALDRLAIGVHRYTGPDKREAYRDARDAVARAAMALLLSGQDGTIALLEALEREMIPAITGALRRTERRGRDAGDTL